MSLAYESNADLAFDTETLQTAGKQYADASDELRQLGGELNDLLSILKESGWTTNAGKAFARMVSEDWSVKLERYCELLTTLSDTLRDAADRYSLLVDEVDKLRL